MRSNGASVADLVILLISAQDGICQQTRESIGCAEAFDLPVIVALNKVRKRFEVFLLIRSRLISSPSFKTLLKTLGDLSI
jgi:translation initiation factor IF-2